MAPVENMVEILFIANRGSRIEILYYCPRCESVNEALSSDDLSAMKCRDCQQINDASAEPLELDEPHTSDCFVNFRGSVLR